MRMIGCRPTARWVGSPFIFCLKIYYLNDISPYSITIKRKGSLMSNGRGTHGKRGRHRSGEYHSASDSMWNRFDRYGRPVQRGITSTYFVLDWYEDTYQPCESLDHACAVAFGKNKRNCNQNCLACVRTKDYFVCL